jgi:hypothetical protein
METLNEFVIKLYASLIYRKKSIHFLLTYYGQIDRSDDFLNGSSDVYTLQLIDIKPVPKNDFDIQPVAINQVDDGPFMTMKEQLTYVDRINQIHLDENDID